MSNITILVRMTDALIEIFVGALELRFKPPHMSVSFNCVRADLQLLSDLRQNEALYVSSSWSA
jgi:hypothetical protein